MKIEKKSQLINIFEYTDYRSFLKNWYLRKKEQGASAFSYRVFARAAGYASPNFLKLVIEDKRNLSLSSIATFTKVLRLSREEGRYFRSLVLWNQAATAEEKERYGRQIFRSKKMKTAQPLREAQFNYFSHWYFVPVREKAIDELQSLQLIKKDQRGKLLQTDPVINTSDELASASVPLFHQEMIKKAGEAIDRFAPFEREVSAACIGLSEENFKRVKQMLQKFRREILAVAAEDQMIEKIYQVNFQFFPLSKNLKKDSEE
jgi:hypothetical protein